MIFYGLGMALVCQKTQRAGAQIVAACALEKGSESLKEADGEAMSKYDARISYA